MKELEGRDPNDAIRITISLGWDDLEKQEDWVISKLDALKEYDPGFYYRYVQGTNGGLFFIDTKVRNTMHDDFKRFLFQARIKFAENLKIR